MSKLFFVFDVESVGLHGEGFAVGFVVNDETGKELESGLFACDYRAVSPSNASDLEWVETNIPDLPVTHTTPTGFRNAFWKAWMQWRERGAIMVADCSWPVEARFLARCIDHNLLERKWCGPYPLHDLASILLAKGIDPVGTFPRKENEVPQHNPLCDARQSARILFESLNQIPCQPKDS